VEILIITGPEQVKMKVGVKFAWKWEGLQGQSFNFFYLNLFYNIFKVYTQFSKINYMNWIKSVFTLQSSVF